MTKIEWVRNDDGSQGETWNPVTGCTKVSEGCRNCYAERMARRLAGRCGYPEAPHQFDVTLHLDKLDLPLRWKKPRMIFVVSMGDLFHKDVPNGLIFDVWDRMARTPQHTYQILTKRPDRMAWAVNRIDQIRNPAFTWPLPNVWLGTSVENQAAADGRIPLLLQTPAAVRFVSAEPLLGAVDLLQCGAVESDAVGGVQGAGYREFERTLETFVRNNIDWVICGGESGPGARPMHPGWARGLRDQCQQAGVPVFVKQMGTVWAKNQFLQGKSLYAYGDTKGHEMKYWPEDLRVREMPNG